MMGKSGVGADREGFWASLQKRLKKVTGSDRVLQIEELRAAVSEFIEIHALRGLHMRYLPSELVIGVSRDDHVFLSPFLNYISEAVNKEFVQRITTGEWVSTIESPGIRLEIVENLLPGSSPILSLAYPKGKKRSFWAPGRSRESSSKQGKGFSIIMTPNSDFGTAVQEMVHLYLDRRLPSVALDSHAEAGVFLEIQDGEVRVVGGERWFPPAGVALEVHGSLESQSAGAPADLWVRRRQPGKPTVIWCPEGSVTIGRGEETAQITPGECVPQLSQRHLCLRLEEGDCLSVTDLASTNGTWIDGRRVVAGKSELLEFPAILNIGERGRLVIVIRRGVTL